MSLFRNIVGGGQSISAIEFCRKSTGFTPNLTRDETSYVIRKGQEIAREMDQSRYNKPRSGYQYKFPECAVGELNAIRDILELKKDWVGVSKIKEAASEFSNSYKDKIPFLSVFMRANWPVERQD